VPVEILRARGSAFSGAYDAIANLVHVYEPARRTLTAYTGALVRLRRDSDDTESDFGYTATGELNVAAIAAWLGVSAGYVVTVYDQVGGDPVTQAVEAAQPLYVASAQNGHAAAVFNGTSQYLQGAFTIGGAVSQPVNVLAVAQLTAAPSENAVRKIFDGNDSTNRMLTGKLNAASSYVHHMYAGVSLLSTVAADGACHIWTTAFNGGSSVLRRDGVSIDSGNAGTANLDGITMGANYTGAADFWQGPIAAVLVLDPALSVADRAALETTVNAYWGVY